MSLLRIQFRLSERARLSGIVDKEAIAGGLNQAEADQHLNCVSLSKAQDSEPPKPVVIVERPPFA
jgi:hypothetical protein